MDNPPATNPDWNSVASDLVTSDVSCGILNIGSEGRAELPRYMDALDRCQGKTAAMDLLPLLTGDVPDTSADISALIKALNYAHGVSAEESAANFVTWYKTYYA